MAGVSKYVFPTKPPGFVEVFKYNNVAEAIKLQKKLIAIRDYWSRKGVEAAVVEPAANELGIKVLKNENPARNAPAKPKAKVRKSGLSRIERSYRAFYREAFLALLPNTEENSAHDNALQAAGVYKVQLELWAEQDAKKKENPDGA